MKIPKQMPQPVIDVTAEPPGLTDEEMGKAVKNYNPLQMRPQEYDDHVRSKETELKLVGLILSGCAHEKAAKVMKLPVSVMRTMYHDIIDTAEAEANADVAIAAMQMAINGENPTITKFWLEARMGWKGTRAKVVDDDEPRTIKELEELSDDELDERIKALESLEAEESLREEAESSAEIHGE